MAIDLNNDEMYKRMREDYSSIMKKGKALMDAMKAYRRSLGVLDEDEMFDHGTNVPKPFLDYPYNNTLLDKFQYLEGTDPILGTFWKRSEMVELIEKVEGKNTKTVNNLQFHIRNYIDDKKLIVVKYNKSNKKVFYATNYAWITKNGDKTDFKNEHGHDEMKAMTEKERSDALWEGV